MDKEIIEELKIDEEAVAICVANATLSTDGVHSLSGGITSQIVNTILKKGSLSKGVKISKPDKAIVVDVFVIVDYGVRIPDVSFNLQRKIKSDLKDETGLKPEAVNIHIQGVATDEEK